MNQKPSKAAGSLIERAAQAYGFDQVLKVPPVVPVAPVLPTVPQAPIAPTPYPAMAPAIAANGANAAISPINRTMLQEQGFIVPGAPPSGLSEEFRLVKRQLLLAALGGKKTVAVNRGQLILVCSAQPNEGKTFSAVNLALSMATETDIEVVLVDADVAKPEVLSTLGLPGGPGLMDALADPAINVENLLIHTDIPNLLVLPTGRQTNNDTELLASDSTGRLIEQLVSGRPRRIVLFDSAPALAASPASTLALHVGQILFVVRADSTPESDVRDAIELLDGCPHIQLILNSVTCHASNRKFGSYYGFGE